MTLSPTAEPPTRQRASTAMDQAIADAEIDHTIRASDRLAIKRENARASCGEFFDMAKVRGLPPPPCPGCEARALDPTPQRRGGHR